MDCADEDWQQNQKITRVRERERNRKRTIGRGREREDYKKLTKQPDNRFKSIVLWTTTNRIKNNQQRIT